MRVEWEIVRYIDSRYVRTCKYSEDTGNVLCAYFEERWDGRGFVGETNVPEWFGWLSVSTGFTTDSDGYSFSDVVQS